MSGLQTMPKLKGRSSIRRARKKQFKKLSAMINSISSPIQNMVSPSLGPMRKNHTGCEISKSSSQDQPLTHTFVDVSGKSESFALVSTGNEAPGSLQDSLITPDCILKSEVLESVDSSPLEDTCKTDEAAICTSADPLAVDDINLLTEAKRKLDKCLYHSWVTFIDNGGLHVCLLSRKKEKAIQRRLFFTAEGEVKLSVHCIPFPMETLVNLSKIPPQIVLTNDTINGFVERCLAFVEILRNYEICTGQSNVKSKHVWSAIQFAVIDTNPYQECRYSETLRSDKCLRLVPLRRWRCIECDKLSGAIRRRVELYSQENPHPTTPNICLSDEQRLKKLEVQRKAINNLWRRKKLS